MSHSPAVSIVPVALPEAAGIVVPISRPQPRRTPLARKGSATDAPPPDLRVLKPHEATPLTLAELVDLYFAAKPCGHMFGAFRKWFAWFGLGEVSAWDIQAEQLGEASKYLRDVKGYAVSTVNRELSQLGTIYKWAVEFKHAPPNFVSPTLQSAVVGRLKETPRYVENAKPGEWERIRKIARGCFRERKFTLFVWLLMDTGCRRSEIADRTWHHFNLDEVRGPNIVLKALDTKTGKPRRVYFSHETAALVRQLRPGSDKARDELVFRSPRGAQANKFRKSWARLCHLIGRDDLHVQDLRHLIAADLIDAGHGLVPVATLLGHSSQVLQRRYAHLDDGTVRTIQAERLKLDEAPVEFAPVAEARSRHAAAQAAQESAPMVEAQRLALLAQDAAAAAEAAAQALAAAQAAMRVAMQGTPATPRAA